MWWIVKHQWSLNAGFHPSHGVSLFFVLYLFVCFFVCFFCVQCDDRAKSSGRWLLGSPLSAVVRQLAPRAWWPLQCLLAKTVGVLSPGVGRSEECAQELAPQSYIHSGLNLQDPISSDVCWPIWVTLLCLIRRIHWASQLVGVVWLYVVHGKHFNIACCVQSFNQILSYLTGIIDLIMIIAIITIIIALKGAIRDFLQSPDWAANCLQHARSNDLGATMCISHATHRATCVPRSMKEQLSY